MVIFFRIVGIILIVLSLLLLIAVPPAGVVGLLLGVFLVIISRKKAAEKINASLAKRQQQLGTDTEEKAAQEQVDIGAEDSVFIGYTDANNNVSYRTIEIQKVYEKDGKLCVSAYCYSKEGDRTFLVDRVFYLKTKANGGEQIKDVRGFFRAKMKESSSVSAADLAAEAVE